MTSDLRIQDSGFRAKQTPLTGRIGHIMRFRVIGQNKTTGARQVLEFEAESKGAAERKATTQGMTVNRVEDISDGGGPNAGVDYEGGQNKRIRRMHPILKTII